ncbi:MAG: hypothetical protein DRJ03_17330 [Chloroflexi bacterium]|nr:MAG: hypothetical protein DRJ03_17330 [Chloroflexota bacterium]
MTQQRYRLVSFRKFYEKLYSDEKFARTLVEDIRKLSGKLGIHIFTTIYGGKKYPGLLDLLRVSFGLTRREAVLAFFAILAHPKVAADLLTVGYGPGQRAQYVKLMEEMGLERFLKQLEWSWPMVDKVSIWWRESPVKPPPSWKRRVRRQLEKYVEARSIRELITRRVV